MLSAVCKKLNNDIELLANQIGLRESAIGHIDANQQNQGEQLRQFNVDLQGKIARTDAIIQKLQNDIEQLSHMLREAMNGQQELSRGNAQRYQELKLEVKICIFIEWRINFICRFLD